MTMAEPQESTDHPAFSRLPAPTGDKRRIQLEVLVVLSIAFLPDLFNAFVAFLEPNRNWSSFSLRSLALIIRSLSVCAVVLYILKLNGDGSKSVGLNRPHLVIDPVVGVIAFYAYLLCYRNTAVVVWHLAQIGVFPIDWLDPGSAERVSPLGAAGVGWLLAMSIANGFAEELVMRGYLITRLRQLLGSTVGAIALSTALFASYHLYQGPYGVYNAVLFGGVMAIIFVMTNRLWPCVIAHAIANSYASLWA